MKSVVPSQQQIQTSHKAKEICSSHRWVALHRKEAPLLVMLCPHQKITSNPARHLAFMRKTSHLFLLDSDDQLNAFIRPSPTPVAVYPSGMCNHSWVKFVFSPLRVRIPSMLHHCGAISNPSQRFNYTVKEPSGCLGGCCSALCLSHEPPGV